MTKVKDKLSGRQVGLTGVNQKGQPRTLYLSNEADYDQLIHLNLEGKELFVSFNELIDAIGYVWYGPEYMNQLKHAKHAERDNNEI